MSSGGGWDDPATSRVVDDGDAPSAPVFEPIPAAASPLGRGGHGVVYAAPDRRLPRDVAWKSAPPDDPVGEARLRHEAAILASLEHPGIIPVYELAIGEDGSTRLALRRIHGQNLRERIAATEDLRGRLPLLRHVLLVAEALAFAHHRGVIHRDVKASNIMVGAWGETLLIDWGLALRLSDDAPPGDVSGTPEAMSPEQARGERVGPTTDVWSLGVILVEVLTGRGLFPEMSATAILARLRRGDRPDLLRLLGSAPSELVAIAERALSTTPEARYPDAQAFAADLQAFLDGRTVAAHVYTLRQRTARFLRRYRLPVALVGAVVTTVLIATRVAFVNIATERDRALKAEQSATRALLRAGIAIARKELTDEARPEAELAAALALDHGESAEARGIISAFATHPRPERLQRVATTDDGGACADAAFSPGGAHLVCYSRSVARVFPVPARAEAPIAPTMVASGPWIEVGALRDGFIGTRPGGRLEVHALDGRRRSFDKPCGGLISTLDNAFVQSRGSCLSWTPDALTTAPTKLAVCGLQVPIQAATVTEGGWTALCVDGDLHRFRGGHVTRVMTSMASPSLEHRALLELPGDRLLVGTTRGDLLLLDATTGELLNRTSLHPGRLIVSMTADPPNDRVIVVMDGVGATAVHHESLAPLTRLPAGDRVISLEPTGTILSWSPRDASGETRRPAAISRWRVDSGPTHLVSGLIGVIAINPSHDGLLAVAHTTTASVLHARTGVVAARRRWDGIPAMVVKGVAIERTEPDGALIVTAAMTAADHPASTLEHDAEPSIRAYGSYRRALEIGGGKLVAARAGSGLHILDRQGECVAELFAGRHEGFAFRDGWLATVPDEVGDIHLFDLRAGPLYLGSCDGLDAGWTDLGMTPEGLMAFVAWPEAVAAIDPFTCAVVRVFESPRETPRRVAVTSVVDTGDWLPGGAPHPGVWIAAGTRLGEVSIWDWEGTLRARVTGHVEPVTALAFAPGGRYLYSGAWDGRVRRYDMAPLVTDRQTLVRAIRSAWADAPL